MAPCLFDVQHQTQPMFVANGERRPLGRFSRLGRMAACCLSMAVMACCLSPICFAAEPSAKTSGTLLAAGEFLIGEPVRYENLSIFPVSTKVAHDDDRFVTLDEGLKAGTVRVFEVGAANAASDVPANSADRQARANAALQTPQPSAQPAAPAQTGSAARQRPNASSAVSRSSPQSDSEPLEVQGDVNRLVLKNSSSKPLYLMPGEIIVGGKQDRTIAQETIIAPGPKLVPIDVFCVEHGRWSGRADSETVGFGRAWQLAAVRLPTRNGSRRRPSRDNSI